MAHHVHPVGSYQQTRSNPFTLHPGSALLVGTTVASRTPVPYPKGSFADATLSGPGLTERCGLAEAEEPEISELEQDVHPEAVLDYIERHDASESTDGR
jgi:hypothetical protein